MINNKCLRKTAWLGLIFFAALGVPLAHAQTATLASLQAMYTNKVAGLDTETQKKKFLAVQEYGADLQTTLKTVQKSGDFDGYVLVEKEIARFKSEKTVPASNSAPQLATNLAAYQKKLETFNTESGVKKIELSKQYLETLVSVRKELMIQDKMKEAGEVNEAAKLLEADIKQMEAWTSQTGDVAAAPVKPETKLDELFGDEPEPAEPKIATAEMTKVAVTGSPAVKKKSKKGPPEAVEFNGHFYQYCAEKIKWDTAKSKCQTRGGHLVSITSKEENDFVGSLVNGKSVVWIGFYKPVDAWKWTTLEKVDYSNWGSGKPNINKRSPYMGVGICAFIRGTEYVQPSSYRNGFYRHNRTELCGQWGDAYSDASVDGYVCEWDE